MRDVTILFGQVLDEAGMCFSLFLLFLTLVYTAGLRTGKAVEIYDYEISFGEARITDLT